MEGTAQEAIVRKGTAWVGNVRGSSLGGTVLKGVLSGGRGELSWVNFRESIYLEPYKRYYHVEVFVQAEYNNSKVVTTFINYSLI